MSLNPNPTPQQLNILRAVIQYGTVREAARRLFLSAHTIDRHMDELREISGRRYVVQIAFWAVMRGHLRLDEIEL